MKTATPMILLLLAACGNSRQEAEQPLTWESIGTSECATCGMVVAEQPAPRGQLVHRDGTRTFFCSLGDLYHYQAAPSPHGKALAIFVEVLDPANDPLALDLAEQPWAPVGEASFVLGLKRVGIMGTPLVAYQSREDAEKTAQAHGARSLDWASLASEM